MILENSLNLMTYNLRYDNAQDGENSWKYRKDAVADMIQKHQVDLLGTQEGLAHQILDLQKALPAYRWVGVGRDDGREAGELMAIFYLADRFNLQAHGHFWLSETPDVVGSQSWGSACKRMVTWARLYDHYTDKILYHFNTHFDHRSEQARRASATLLHDKVKTIAATFPAIITGDFNLTPQESVYTLLTSYFTDIRALFPDKTLPTTTFNGFSRQGQSGMWIDYIFTPDSKQWLYGDFAVLQDKYEQKFPSDHFPIWVQLEIA